MASSQEGLDLRICLLLYFCAVPEQVVLSQVVLVDLLSGTC